MRLSNVNESKDKLIGTIKGFFDTKFIEEIALLTKFVQRRSKLQAINFFSLRLYGKERRDNKFGGLMQGITNGRS
jgi:hypothetical protein